VPGDLEPLTIRIDRRLDVATAREVAERVRVAARERDVVIEFSLRVQCELVALSFLADVIEQRGSPVFVRGLSGHDVRILEYLGVSLPSSPDPEFG
jgi:hypothetical protein